MFYPPLYEWLEAAETSDSQLEQLRIVVQEAEDDRKKLQNLKENNHELCKTYLDTLVKI